MAQFPTSLPVFNDFNPAHTLAQDNHAARHNAVHAETAAIAAKIGANGSADTNSFDYKLSAVTGSNKAETQGNKKSSIDTSTVSFPTNKAVKDYVDAAVAAAIANMMTTDTAQTITALKNFTAGLQLNGSSVVSRAANETITGDKAFTGVVDLSGASAVKFPPKYTQNLGGTGTGARQNIASGATNDIAGCSLSYTAGDKNELLYVFGNLLCTSGVNSEVWMRCGSDRIGSSLYKCTTAWEMYHGGGFYVVPANTTVTFILVCGAFGGAATVANANTDVSQTYRPQLGAFRLGVL